jgi:hypothetical protein
VKPAKSFLPTELQTIDVQVGSDFFLVYSPLGASGSRVANGL